jgi:hypothetical protein
MTTAAAASIPHAPRVRSGRWLSVRHPLHTEAAVVASEAPKRPDLQAVCEPRRLWHTANEVQDAMARDRLFGLQAWRWECWGVRLVSCGVK